MHKPNQNKKLSKVEQRNKIYFAIRDKYTEKGKL